MTVQAPDRLILECPAIELGELHLYGIATGDIRLFPGWGTKYAFTNQPLVPPGAVCSALWRGYVATFCLRADGRLELIRYDYPLSKPKTGVDISEFLEGDFWMILKSDFKGDRVYVPFVAGRVNPDEAAWVVENNTALETVRRYRRPEVVERSNIPLTTPVFLGKIQHRVRDEEMDNWVWVRLDREFSRQHYWCACKLLRDGERLAVTKLSGSRGRGRWLLSGLTERDVEINDELWATECLPETQPVQQAVPSNSGKSGDSTGE